MRRLAEEPGAHSPPGPGNTVLPGDGYILWIGSNRFYTHVQAVHFGAEEVEARLAEVRARAAAEGASNVFWWIGSTFTPPGVGERLRELGLVMEDRPPVLAETTAMVLAEPPPPAPTGVEARPIETYEELLETIEINRDAFGIPEERYASLVAAAPQSWSHRNEPDAPTMFIAFVEGRPVGRAAALFAPAGAILLSGATRAEARGRGAYRGLVRARWDEAVRRGTPALTVQAGPMSRPILQRLGFRAIGEIAILVDEGPW